MDGGNPDSGTYAPFERGGAASDRNLLLPAAEFGNASGITGYDSGNTLSWTKQIDGSNSVCITL